MAPKNKANKKKSIYDPSLTVVVDSFMLSIATDSQDAYVNHIIDIIEDKVQDQVRLNSLGTLVMPTATKMSIESMKKLFIDQFKIQADHREDDQYLKWAKDAEFNQEESCMDFGSCPIDNSTGVKKPVKVRRQMCKREQGLLSPSSPLGRSSVRSPRRSTRSNVPSRQIKLNFDK